MVNKILMTGGSGLLGSELKPILEMDTPSHKELDITKPIKPKKYDMVIHAAAYTDVVGAELNRIDCYGVNVLGTMNMIVAYSKLPFVYISTEYVKNVVNHYSQSKFIAEGLVRSLCPKHLIIRTLFKPRPFPWPKAFSDQYTTGDYVDVIAPMIKAAIDKWDKKKSYIVEIGTGRKTMYELAKKSNPKVKKMSVKDVVGVKLPEDYL